MKSSRIITHGVVLSLVVVAAIVLHNEGQWAARSERYATAALGRRRQPDETTLFGPSKSAAGGQRRDQEVIEDTTEESYTVDVTFEDILKTVIFLLTSWIMAVLSTLIGLPSLVGEITTGFVLGPPLLDFVAYPEAMVLIGSFGLIGLLLDSGINLDVAQLQETGSRAVLLAVTGTILALGAGAGMGYLAHSGEFRSAMAVGVAFAPSSFGVASQVLKKGQFLNTPMGQVIVAASVVDDILGLILLSIMEVLVQDDPNVIDYLIPFISSFGYLLFLGYVGIALIPQFLEEILLPRVKEHKRDFVAFSLLFVLLSAYLPILYYSGASYLTGAFLAGLSFSQVHSVHAKYVKSGTVLKTWLMRIFFAATIGFQVPITYFSEDDVTNWGFLYFIPVLAKIPLGFLVPKMKCDVPDDFPYDPYKRDAIITTLAMLCRGEFNFIVASFALSAGVLDPNQYAAVVFAILLSAIIFPLMLSKVMEFYNNKFNKFLSGKHTIERIGDTNDGTRPLFLAIQARTPVKWGIQEKFKGALESAGLVLLDHRSWHTLGLNAVHMTEIFCQDKLTQVRIRRVFDSGSSIHTNGSSEEEHDGDAGIKPTSLIPSIKESPSRENLAMVEDMQEEEEDEQEQAAIENRKDEIRKALVDCLEGFDESEFAIVVSQWTTMVFAAQRNASDDLRQSRHQTGYSFIPPEAPIEEEERGEVAEHDEETGNSDPLVRDQSTPIAGGRLRAFSVGSQADGLEDPILDADLWDADDITHNLTREGFFMNPVDDTGTQNVTEGCPGEVPAEELAQPGHRRGNSRGSSSGGTPRTMRHHRARTIDAGMLSELNRDIETSTIKDRLAGYIRPSGGFDNF